MYRVRYHRTRSLKDRRPPQEGGRASGCTWGFFSMFFFHLFLFHSMFFSIPSFPFPVIFHLFLFHLSHCLRNVAKPAEGHHLRPELWSHKLSKWGCFAVQQGALSRFGLEQPVGQCDQNVSGPHMCAHNLPIMLCLPVLYHRWSIEHAGACIICVC